MTANFSASEFACKCGCGGGGESIQPSFVALLQRAREIAGVPFVVTSGLRCVEHNRRVGGVDSSAHVNGWAADVACRDSALRGRIVAACFEAGFRRVGAASAFVHVDNDPTKPSPMMWVY